MPGQTHNKYIVMICLLFAGEMIFSLPFHIARFFRPTVLEVFQFDNTTLGDVFAIYGICAMLAYFPGGLLADRFSVRILMSSALLATALGGLYLASIPASTGMAVLFGYWGVTTILLFWAAMLKATRHWGGAQNQGQAFGLLEGGRGLTMISVGFIASSAFAFFGPADLSVLTDPQRRHILQNIIYFYTAMTLLAAILVWYMLPHRLPAATDSDMPPRTQFKKLFAQPLVWLQALIVVCAYCGYKGIDYYSLFAHQILNKSEDAAAEFTLILSILRPLTAIIAGLVADRFAAAPSIKILFLALLISYAVLATLQPQMLALIYLNIAITLIAIYAIRGIYFALVAQTGIPYQLTGTAVGLISFIGFTPDIFFASITGRILDASPGIEGYHDYFLLLALFALSGMLATLLLVYLQRRRATATD